MAKTILYMNSFKELPVSNDYVTFLGGGSLNTTDGHLTKLGGSVGSLTGQLNSWLIRPSSITDYLLNFDLDNLDDFPSGKEIIISFSIRPGKEATVKINNVEFRAVKPNEWSFVQISIKKPSSSVVVTASLNKNSPRSVTVIGSFGGGIILTSSLMESHKIDDLSIVLHDTSPGLINEQFIASTPINAITHADGAFSSDQGTAAAAGDITDIDTKWIGTTIADSEVTVAHNTTDIATIKNTLDNFIFDPNSLLINGVSLTTNAKVQGDITKIVQGVGTDTIETDIAGASDAADAEYTSTTTYHSVGAGESITSIDESAGFDTKIKFTN